MIYTDHLKIRRMDYYCTMETFKLGANETAVSPESLIGGGKGINVSLMLAQLGVPTTALGFAAGFTGEELIRQLRDQAVNADLFAVRRDKRGLTSKSVREWKQRSTAADPRSAHRKEKLC